MELLRVVGLSKAYGKKQVLSDLALSLEENETYALIGVNGAGKSTLIEIICGVRRADAGQVLFRGDQWKDSRREMRRLIGYMPQQSALFPDLTVRENLLYLGEVYGIENAEKRASEVEEICSLRDKKDMEIRRLSGGYRQLASLAAAILHRPPLLILDEPTSALDPLFRCRFWETIHTFSGEGTTVLVSTHHMEEIRECGRLLCLANGKIAKEGSVVDLFADGRLPRIEELLREQLEGGDIP